GRRRRSRLRRLLTSPHLAYPVCVLLFILSACRLIEVFGLLFSVPLVVYFFISTPSFNYSFNLLLKCLFNLFIIPRTGVLGYLFLIPLPAILWNLIIVSLPALLGYLFPILPLAVLWYLII
ncbi:hypothetical protein PDJAM_G00196460, partial [Pangasius djambal]|nr:hypothetical protein [Pangasius djambal]